MARLRSTAGGLRWRGAFAVMPRRVLHLIPSLAGGGAERQVTTLARAMAALGTEVHVGLLSGGVYLPRLLASDVSVHMLPAIGHYNPALAWEVRKLARYTGAEVVQTFLSLMDVWGGIGARLAGRAWTLSECSTAGNYARNARTAVRRRVGRLADLVIANSHGGARYWEACGMPASRCVVVPNALPIAEIGAALPPDDIDTITGGRPLVLCVGRLITVKNPEQLVEALALAAPHAEFVALLCGEGPLEQKLRARIESHGLTDRVKLAGFRDDVWGLMHRASLLLAVSLHEGRPYAVLEAMAGECPLVVSDIPAHREFLDPETAVFVPTSDPGAIAEAIVAQLAAPEVARRRARQARAAILPYDAMAVADRHLALYDQVLNHRVRGAAGNAPVM